MLGTCMTHRLQPWLSGHGGAEPSTKLGVLVGGSLGCEVRFAKGFYRNIVSLPISPAAPGWCGSACPNSAQQLGEDG